MEKDDHLLDAFRYMQARKTYWSTTIKGDLTFDELRIKLSESKNHQDIEDIRVYFNLNKKNYTVIQVQFFVELFEDKRSEIREKYKSH